MERKLTAERVTETIKSVLFTDAELADGKPSEIVEADGVIRQFGFHPARLEAAKPAISEMLSELPEQFHEATGGGWSLLNGCMHRDGEMWTGMQTTVAELFALGVGAGLAVYPLPREFWPSLPGGVPYFMVKVTT